MSFSSPRILVSGATGFIGRHLVRRLLARGCEIHGVSRREPEGYSEGVRWWRGDLTDTDRFQEIVSVIAPDRIVHLASHVSGDRSLARVLPTFRDNLLSSVGVLVAASKTGCSRVILAGSMEEPGAGESVPVPSSPYAAAKWAASAYARMFEALYGLHVVLVRIAMVYGPGQVDTTKLVPYVVRSLLRNEAPALGSGERAVDWVYVEDVADGIDRACFAEQMDGRTVDLGSGSLVTIRSVVERLVAITSPSIAPRFGAIPDRPLEREWVTDVARAESLLGWRATTPLDEGLIRTVQWYKKHP